MFYQIGALETKDDVISLSFIILFILFYLL